MLRAFAALAAFFLAALVLAAFALAALVPAAFALASAGRRAMGRWRGRRVAGTINTNQFVESQIAHLNSPFFLLLPF